MPLKITRQDWRALFPRAPDAIIAAFASQPHCLDDAGITANRRRLAYTLANLDHESGGFTVPRLTENINYSAERLAKIFPRRFADAATVRRRFGTGKGWQLKAFDEIYGHRMGNADPGDGSRFIGRGGPQLTGRDSYEQVGKRCGLDLLGLPELATRPEHQPVILAAFCSWKGLLVLADRADFPGFVRAWNGGTIGLAARRAQLTLIAAIIRRLGEAG